MSLSEQYLQAICYVRTTVLNLIEAEKRYHQSGALVNEVDMLFEHVINLPGDSVSLYKCRLMIIEALEDLRISFEARRESEDKTTNGSYWHSKRASYLLKIQAAEQEIRGLPE